MLFIKANLAFIPLKIVMLFHRQRQWAEKIPNTAVNTAATTPSPSTLYSQEKKLDRDKHWWCSSVCLYMKFCLPEHRRNEKTRKHAPCSQISFLSPPLPLGCFAWACCQHLSQAFSWFISWPITLVLSQSSIPPQISNQLFGEGWLMEAFTAEFWGVSRKSVINVQFWICNPHHSPHFLTGPPTSIGTPWLVSISPSCSSTASQNFISPKHGDFQQWLGLWVCLWEANASSLKYWAYSLESTEKKEGAKEQRYCWLIKELIKVISWVQKMHL